MHATAVILDSPQSLRLGDVELTPPTAADVVVDIAFSGISTGTERLLWSGRMPPFPGLGYPLIPGYESVGTVIEAGSASGRAVGEAVFVPGSRNYLGVRGLFGGAASRIVLPGAKAVPLPPTLGAGETGILFALAATARHALVDHHGAPRLPDLIVGHGVLGRLAARIAVAMGGAPTVWEVNATRRDGADGYAVIDPASDDRRDYATILDVSGDGSLLDTLVMRLKPQGEIVLAGFYAEPLSFAFPPAFMREARFSIAAEWKPQDLDHCRALLTEGRLSLDGLVTHTAAARNADAAYRTAFGDPACLKMVLDWRTHA